MLQLLRHRSRQTGTAMLQLNKLTLSDTKCITFNAEFKNGHQWFKFCHSCFTGKEPGDIAVTSSTGWISSDQLSSQTPAANIGRWREPKHVIYNTVNHMETSQCLIQSSCCCDFLLSFWGRQLNRQSISVAQDTLPKECGHMWPRPPLKCGLSDWISNMSSLSLGGVHTCA